MKKIVETTTKLDLSLRSRFNFVLQPLKDDDDDGNEEEEYVAGEGEIKEPKPDEKDEKDEAED
jgi:hypothetical protein